MAGLLGVYDLNDAIDRLAPGSGESGRRAETLLKHDRLRVVLITMRASAALHEHTAPGPITIQPLRGRFRVTVDDAEHECSPGQVVAVDTGVRHAVEAIEPGAFLLTIAWAQSSA